MLQSYFKLIQQRILSLVLAAIFLGLVPAVLPIEEFGQYSLVFSVIQVVGSGFLSLGNQALFRFACEEFSEKKQIGETLVARLIIYAVMLVFILPIVWVAFPKIHDFFGLTNEGLIYIMVGLVIISFNEMGTFAAQSINQYVGYGLAPVLLRAIQLATLLILAYIPFDAWTALLIGTLFGYFCTAVFSWSRIPIKAVSGLSFSKKILEKYISYSWSIPLATLSLMLINVMDVWFLQYFKGVDGVASYAWAYNIPLLVAALLAPLAALLTHQFVELRVENNLVGEIVFSKGAQALWLLVASLCPLGVSIIYNLFSLLNLGDYQDAVVPISILTAVLVFQFGLTFWEAMIRANERLVWRGAIIIFFMAGINAVGDYFFIPDFGGVGAAYATAIAYGIGAIGHFFVIRVLVTNKGLLSSTFVGLFPLACVVCSMGVLYLPLGIGLFYGLICSFVFFSIGRVSDLFKPSLKFADDMLEGVNDTIKFKIIYILEKLVGGYSFLGNDTTLPPPISFMSKNKDKDFFKTDYPNRPISIVVVVNKLAIGGTERHLLQNLPNLNREKFKISIFVLQSGGTLEGEFIKHGIKINVANKSKNVFFGRLKALFYLNKYFKDTKPDIIHFFLPEAYLIGGLAAFIAGHQRCIMSRRSLNYYQKKHQLAACFEEWLHARMSAIIGNSKAVVHDLMTEGVHQNQLGLIYNGIDITKYHNSQRYRDVQRRKLGINSHAIVLIIVANLISYKGHADLLAGLSHIKNRMPNNWKLLCVGRDDGIGKALKNQVAKLGLEENVIWLGQRTDVIELLSTSDIGILCSHEEGFSNSLLEGMASKLPMVVTDVGGNSEAVRHGTTGYLVPPQKPEMLGQAILKLALSKKMREEMGVNGALLVQSQFSTEACLRNYEILYRYIYSIKEKS